MSSYQRYVAIDNFSLNVSKNGATKTLEIKMGDALDFDETNVVMGGEEQGTAAALRKVKGEWIEAYNGSDEFLLKVQEKIRGRIVKPQSLRKVIANSTVEHSSPDTNHDLSRNPAPGTNKELKKIVNEEETALKVVNDDQREVRKVTKDDQAAETRSSSSVEISDAAEEKKREIISDEDSVAKKTTYDNKKEDSKNTESTEKVSVEEDVVVETAYDDPKRTDISSSTQAQVEEKPAKTKATGKKTVSKKATSKKSPTKKVEEDALEGLTIEDSLNTPLDQDGVVVKKGSPIEVEGNIRDIDSKLTIGGVDSEDSGVVFESNSEITVGKASFSKSGEDIAVDITSDNAVVVTDSDDSIDVSSLLDSL